MYEEMNTNTKLYKFSPDEKVTVIYTYKNDTYNNGGWAYVKNSAGTKGFVGMKSLSSIE